MKLFKDKVGHAVISHNYKRFSVVFVNFTQKTIISEKFTGTITECESWINLQKSGHLYNY